MPPKFIKLLTPQEIQAIGFDKNKADQSAHYQRFSTNPWGCTLIEVDDPAAAGKKISKYLSVDTVGRGEAGVLHWLVYGYDDYGCQEGEYRPIAILEVPAYAEILQLYQEHPKLLTNLLETLHLNLGQIFL
jgi:hypothetical protein